MRNLLIGLFFVLLSGLAAGGVYDDILDAAERGDSEAVVGLLQRGMDVNTADRDGNTLLMISARTENLELMRFLVSNRAAVNRRNRFGDTALLIAAIKGSVGGVDLLHKSGAQLEPGGWSALHYSVFSDSFELLDWLVKNGAKLDARAPNGQTALMLAAKQGKLVHVKHLIDADADMDLEDFDGKSALALARSGGHEEVVGYLKSAGAVE
ncbi:MAG: ankyrin repeat domain-containing protein [Rhodocyclales bacterium]|nr:ankyrin repeat domain-containing protein [Rhodocyclales bacterium]